MINQAPHYNPLDQASQLMGRLLNSMPAATFEMETFSRLAGIVVTRDLPSAAMECKHRPRLLINPDFVAKYCKRDEHLFLLVMHELWHVMLAHTSLYPRVTKAQNIAFDAIINAGLLRRFNRPEYRGFFEAINPADKFPGLLLRPPVGWIQDPKYPIDIGPKGTARILRQLYPTVLNSLFRPPPFYDEILDLIREDMRQKGQIDEVVLIGDHESQDPYKSHYLNDAMGRVSKKWKMKASDFGRPSRGTQVNQWEIANQSATQEMRRAFSNVLRRALGRNAGTLRQKQRQPIQGITGRSVLPNARDRSIHARRLLGAPSTLWEQRGTYKARIPEDNHCAHIYLDVSGSMGRVLPYLLNLITPYISSGKARAFQFSNEVHPLSLADLRNKQVHTTGGTSISCVMEHLLEHRASVQKMLIVTDGRTGSPDIVARNAIQEDNKKVHIVLPAESPYERDLASIATSITVLPSIN